MQAAYRSALVDPNLKMDKELGEAVRLAWRRGGTPAAHFATSLLQIASNEL
jgi:hypothetical protein